jgi:CrcB protein
VKRYARNHFSGGRWWGIGATTRYLTSNWAAVRFGTEFPMGTLLVNVVGCFIIGLFMAVTTFSSFSYETLHLLEEVNVMQAFYNVGLNILVGFFATWLGIGVVKLF